METAQELEQGGTWRSVADIDWRTWQPVDRATLLFVVADDQILLIRKKRGLGAGKINGPGGRLDAGESPECAAIPQAAAFTAASSSTRTKCSTTGSAS